MRLSVVIPVHNEAENIASLLAEIDRALGILPHEIIFVDDASTDDTLLRLREALQGYPNLRVIRHGEKCGQSTAILTGVEHARAPWIVTLDGDGQNDPADIPVLYAMVRESHGKGRPVTCVCGYRRTRHDSPLRRLSSQIANTVRRRLLGDDTPDSGCGIKIFSRHAFLRLPYFDHMHRFLPALFQRAGGTVVAAEVNHRPRLHGRSKYGLHNRLWVGIIDICGVMWLQRRTKLPEVIEEHSSYERKKYLDDSRVCRTTPFHHAFCRAVAAKRADA